MEWDEIRREYVDQWLIIEALEAHTMDAQRILDKIAVVQLCQDGEGALQAYRELHRHYPQREFYYVHTARAELDIRERQWIGIRRAYGTHTP